MIDFVAKYSRAIPESIVTLGHATTARRSAKIDCAYYACVRNDARESVIDPRKTELNCARRRERTVRVRVAKKLFSLRDEDDGNDRNKDFCTSQWCATIPVRKVNLIDTAQGTAVRFGVEKSRNAHERRRDALTIPREYRVCDMRAHASNVHNDVS